MIGDTAYRATAEEILRYPPEARVLYSVGAAALTDIQGTILEPQAQRATYLQQCVVRTAINGTALQSVRIVGFYLRCLNIAGQEVGDLFSADNQLLQAIIGDSGLASSAGAGFGTTYNFSLRSPILIPAGLGLRFISYGWTSDALVPSIHSFRASVTTLAIPQGNIAR